MLCWPAVVSRRRFLGQGIAGSVALSGVALLGCTSTDVEVVVEHLGGLATLINDDRKQHGLTEIPLSDKLTAVALKHVNDLDTNQPHIACGPAGNLHSWSDQGNWAGKAGVGAWKGCCYPDDHANAACMWDKPKEIAGYAGIGYELVHGSSGTATAQGALNGWLASPAHRAVIRNEGIWANRSWKALGAVYGGNYACAWFGETPA